MKSKHNTFRILYELDKNARASFASIGRATHQSAQEVNRAFDALVENGILKYCYPLIDYRMLGYFSIIYLLKLHNITKEAEEELYQYLSSINEVVAIARADGSFDTMLRVCAKGMFTCERVFQEVLSRFGEYIYSFETVLPAAFAKSPRRYLIEKATREETTSDTVLELVPTLTDETQHEKFKEEHLHILEALNANGRMSLRDVSFQLKISYDKVRYALKKMEEMGIVKGYTYLLDHNRICFPRFRVHLGLRRLSYPGERRLFEWCSREPHIVHYVRLLGGWQLALDVEIESREMLRELLREMKIMFSDMITRAEATHLYQIERWRDLPLKLTWAQPVV